MRVKSIKICNEINDYFAKGNYILAQESYNKNREEINDLLNDLMLDLSNVALHVFHTVYRVAQFEAYYNSENTIKNIKI